MSNKEIYLGAFYAMKPKNHVRTSVAGWMNDPNNIRWDERVEITRGERRTTVQAKILINLTTKQVVRNSWGDNRSFNDLFKYFFKGYHQYVTEIMTQIDAEYFSQMLDEMQAEEAAAKVEVEPAV